MSSDIRGEMLKDFAKSIELFALTCLSHLLTSDIPPFHSEIYKLLPRSKRLVVAAPRGFAKSYLCSVIYPIWLGCVGVYKEITIISASETLAREMMRKVKREFETNERIKAIFGNMVTHKWSETHATLSSGVTFRARGAEGQMRGFRPDCVILDDLETDESVRSEEQRRKIYDWIMRACLPSLVPDGQLLLIGSILSPLAILRQILESHNNWEKRIYRAYKHGVEKAGDELWPTLWPHDRLQQRKREIGSSAFASEYMNNPRSSDTTAIPESSIRYWTILPEQLSAVITVDPAYSEEERADFKVASLVGIDQSMNRYLISYIRTHVQQGEFIDAVLNLWYSNRNIVTAVGIPASGTEAEFFRSVVNKASARKIYPPFTELKNSFITQGGQVKRGKASRIIAALQPLFEQGKYYIARTHEEARNELLDLNPSLTQRWDDILDTMAYAEQILQPTFVSTTQKDKFDEAPITCKPSYGYEF